MAGGKVGAAARKLIAETKLRPTTIQDHLASYKLSDLGPDARAGLNVALLAFPQGMAYALIAEIPVVHGIFCSIVAPILAGLMASSRVTMIGPTNATAALIASTLAFTAGSAEQTSQALIMLTVMIGILLILGAFLKVATLTQYVSRTVIIGYITGAALFIVSKQLHNVLGIPKLEGAFFYNAVWNAVVYLPQTHLPTLVVSLLTFCLLIVFRYGVPKLPGVAMTLAIMSVLAYFEDHFWVSFDSLGVQMLDPVSMAEFQLTLPGFDPTLFSELIGGACAIAFLATIENTFMAKSLASRYGETVDVNQEMLSLGVANTTTGVLSGMPASGSLTRSALNADSGATSPFAGIISGAICLMVVIVLGTFVEYIPIASLAVVVVMTAATLVRVRDIRIAMSATGSDAATFLLTFIAALLAPLNVAIFLGVALSIALFLRKASSPHLVEYAFNEEGNLGERDEQQKRNHPAVSIIHVEGELFFGAADLFREQIRRVCLDDSIKVVVLRMRNARHLDATSVMAMSELIQFLKKKDRHLLISGATSEVYKVVRNSGMFETLDRKNFFLAAPSNPNLSTRKALLRAQELIGQRDVDVRIFVKNSPEDEKT